MFGTMDANEEVYLSSCIHGYHVNNANWIAAVGEELQCAKKLGMQRTNMQSPSYNVQMNITQHIIIMLQISHRFDYCKSIQPRK